MSGLAERLEAHRLMAIVRYGDRGLLVEALSALREGGVEVAEVTLGTPGALEAVAEVASCGHPVGVGTVLDTEDVRRAEAAGACFLVSPGLDEDIVTLALELGVTPVPGVYTASEVARALRSGAEVLKLFPARRELGLLRALRGPFADVAFLPTGGVRLEDAPAWLDAGAVAVAVGADLVGRAAPTSDADLEALRDRARRATTSTRNTEVPS